MRPGSPWQRRRSQNQRSRNPWSARERSPYITDNEQSAIVPRWRALWVGENEGEKFNAATCYESECTNRLDRCFDACEGCRPRHTHKQFTTPLPADTRVTTRALCSMAAFPGEYSCRVCLSHLGFRGPPCFTGRGLFSSGSHRQTVSGARRRRSGDCHSRADRFETRQTINE